MRFDFSYALTSDKIKFLEIPFTVLWLADFTFVITRFNRVIQCKRTLYLLTDILESGSSGQVYHPT